MKMIAISMEQSPSSEANRFSASQIPHILWNEISIPHSQELPPVPNVSQSIPPPPVITLDNTSDVSV
jgi:hypothetical protein